MSDILSSIFQTSKIEVDYNKPTGVISLAVPNASNVDIPGPASGYLRFFDWICTTQNVLAATLANVNISLVDSSLYGLWVFNPD